VGIPRALRGRRAIVTLLALSASLLIGTVSLVATAPAGATTGPTPLAHPPRFEVSAIEAAPYIGRFKLVQPLDRRLISGAYVAETNERGYVEGTIAIYHYEAAGRPSALVARTYEYHAVDGGMEIDVISPQNQVILARIKLHQSGAGRLSGTFRSLMPAEDPQTISLARASVPPEPEEPAQSTPAGGGADAQSPPAEGEAGTQSPPPATAEAGAESSSPNARAVAEVAARAVRLF
jgi:hypothetical protein